MSPSLEGPTSSAWPRITIRSTPWTPTPIAALPERDRVRRLEPYDAAVPARIAEVPTVPLSGEVLSLATEAAAEIARFDAEVGAELAPFEPLLLRSEAAASSQIENLTASARAIALAEIEEGKRKRNATIIVANTRAMQAALALADRIDEQAILDVHEALLGASDPGSVGRWRNEQVWIGGSARSPHGASFVPPTHDVVPAAMGDLVEFMRRYDVPPLVLATVAHAQFETIHPFPDGNGRTGRSLIHALLRAKRLTRSVTVPVSAGLLLDTQRYYDSLTAYRDGEPEVIVELLANATFSAIDNGRRLVSDLRGHRSAWAERITARRGATAHRVADLLVRQPVITSPLVQQELEVAASNTNTAIEHLAEHGILTKISAGSRNRVWAAQDVLHALDAFADRGGRRDRVDADGP